MMSLAPATLEYGKRTLVLTPHDEERVMNMGDIAHDLQLAWPVYVRLEPGDGTVYRFALFAAWHEPWHDWCGGGVSNGEQHILVAPLDGKVYPIGRGANSRYIQEKLEWHGGNAHSARVMEAFLNRVWDGLAILREEVVAL